jgi:hypothetical protein
VVVEVHQQIAGLLGDPGTGRVGGNPGDVTCRVAISTLSRPGARCRCCHRSVSPGRSPNQLCRSPHNGICGSPGVRSPGLPDRVRVGAVSPAPVAGKLLWRVGGTCWPQPETLAWMCPNSDACRAPSSVRWPLIVEWGPLAHPLQARTSRWRSRWESPARRNQVVMPVHGERSRIAIRDDRECRPGQAFAVRGVHLNLWNRRDAARILVPSALLNYSLGLALPLAEAGFTAGCAVARRQPGRSRRVRWSCLRDLPFAL